MAPLTNNMKSAAYLQTCLNIGIDKNDVSSVKSLARYHGELINLNEWNEEGLCPIHQCCINGNKTLLSILLHAGADVNCVDPKGWTALHASSALGHYDFVVHLIKKGANVMAKTSTRELPIDLSLNVQIVLYLGTSMKNIGYGELANIYIKKLSELEMTNTSQAEARVKKRRSFQTQKRREVRPHSILKTRDNISIRDSFTIGDSYIRSSQYLGSSSDDADEDATSTFNEKRLSVQFSAESVFLDYVHGNEHDKLQEILENLDQRMINKLDRKGLSPIHWAAIKGFPECISILARFGADIDVRDPFGWTPLHAAVVSNHVKCIEQLLGLHADIYALTQTGQSVFDWTNQQNITDLLKNT